jgi:hypothetical protein
MTSTDRNDLVPAQEKLEWVTPKISLMGTGDTEGAGKLKVGTPETSGPTGFGGAKSTGPS